MRGPAVRPVSLERKLPLLISALLVVVIGGFTWAAYREVRRSAVATANERLQRVTIQLVDLLGGSVRSLVTNTHDLAARPAVRAYLVAPRPDAAARTRAALQLPGPQGNALAAVELWDATGRRLLVQGKELAPVSGDVSTELRRAVGADTATAIGPIIRIQDSLFFSVVGAVKDGARTLGYVVQRRRVSTSPQGGRQLARLIGSDAALYFGNARGDIWTDFGAEVPPPPIDLRNVKGTVEYERPGKGSFLAYAARLPGSPWMVAVEFPRGPVLASTHAFVYRIALTGLLLIAGGALAAWATTRRMTSSLRQVTDAATAIAAGEPAPIVDVRRGDEIGRLAVAFNVMSGEVRRSREGLEAQVVERTRALGESEARLRAVTETAHDAIIAADGDGNIAYWNPGAAHMFGYAASEVVGRPLTLLMPDRYQEDHRRGIRRYTETAEAHVVGRTVELHGRRKDGNEFPLELSLAAARTEAEISFTGVIRDITERKRIEQALRETNAELEAFSYSVSHDLRAPLRAIHGFARILLEDHGPQLDAEAKRVLTVIDENTRRMGQLIDDLLAFSQLGRKELDTARVDMGDLFRTIADEVRRTAGVRPLDITIGALPPARGDRDMLRQAVTNLLDNAAKFTRRRTPARIEVGHRTDNGEGVYYVKDNGAGFDQRYADKLFGVFQRLHRAEEFEGTGVGLAIVQRIVLRHGGRVWAEGQVDAGATFYLTLPGVSST
jgi:PAS domain S-box-containing protein